METFGTTHPVHRTAGVGPISAVTRQCEEPCATIGLIFAMTADRMLIAWIFPSAGGRGCRPVGDTTIAVFGAAANGVGMPCPRDPGKLHDVMGA